MNNARNILTVMITDSPSLRDDIFMMNTSRDIEPGGYLGCTGCLSVGFPNYIIRDAPRWTAQSAWHIDIPTNPLGAFHVDWVVDREDGFEKVK